MLIHKTYKYRLYPTKEQERTLIRWQGVLRFLWNLGNEQRSMWIKMSRPKYQTAYGQLHELTVLRDQQEWIREVPCCACQGVFLDLDKAWDRCFKRLSKQPRIRKKNKPPVNFKGKRGSPVSISLSNAGRFYYSHNLVGVPKLGNIRAVYHVPPLGVLKQSRITQEGDRWFVCIGAELDLAPPEPRQEPKVGIDMGIAVFAADSNGNFVENKRYYERALQRLARAQRVLSRKKKGSANREKAKHRVMKLHQKVRNQRTYMLHKLSSDYAKNHGVVVVEDLQVSNMVQSNLAKQISDVGWSKFHNLLDYKLAWTGGTLAKVPPHYTSQTCSACGYVDKENRLSQSQFVCAACGMQMNADTNAAKNILSRYEKADYEAKTKRPSIKLHALRRKPKAA